MFYYILRKIGYGLIVIFGVVTLVFVLFTILPGDPAKMLLSDRADQKTIEAVHKQLGLDRPLTIQYLNYLNDLSVISYLNKDKDSYFYFDTVAYNSTLTLIKINNHCIVLKPPYLRRSYQNKQKVVDLISDRLINTIVLAFCSIIIAFIVGVSLGGYSYYHINTWLDRLIQVVTSIGMSLPSFFAAILIAWLFAYLLGDYTHLNMSGSLQEVDDLGRGEYLCIQNLILPTLTLAIRPLAVITELTKTSLCSVMQQDYIRTAKAKGLNRRQIFYRHALKNALNPIISSVTGWLAGLLSGAVFVEYIFGYKGLGTLIVDALDQYDLPVIMGTLLVICIMLVVINIATDIIYGILDPRVRLK